MKISSVKKARIHTSFVDRNTSVGRTDAVESIAPVKKIYNASYYSSENHLMIYDDFYDNLKELRNEYKSFYHDEQLLEKAIDNFDKDNDELLKNMKELIGKYNNAIKSLESFDNVFETNHVQKIQNLLLKFEKQLDNLGICISNTYELMLKEDIFIKKIQSNENALDFLFEPTKGLILKIYYTFKSIKIPKKTAIESKYDDIAYTGMILDNKT